MVEYLRLYNAGYSLQAIQQFYHRDRHLAQPPMTSYSSPSNNPHSFERYRDDIDEKRWRDSSTISDGDWRSEENDDHALGLDKEDTFAPMKAGSDNLKNDLPARRPLITQVRNDWRTDPKYGQMYSPTLERDTFGPPDCLQVMCAKKFKRVVFFIMTLLILSGIAWATWLGPSLAEHLLLRASLDSRASSGRGWFGANMRPMFADMVQLGTLDSNLVPTREGKDRDRRLIIVGDVHGCKDERKSRR